MTGCKQYKTDTQIKKKTTTHSISYTKANKLIEELFLSWYRSMFYYYYW